MSAPRHLWSDDWQSESEAAARERAKQRARAQGPTEGTPPDPPASPAPSGSSAPPAPRVPPVPRVRPVPPGARRRRLRVVALAALVTLLSAGAAYAAVLLLTGSGGASPALTSGARPWLGIETASSGFGGGGAPTVGGFAGGFPTGSGVLLTEVVPGSPAAAAGLAPGDVIMQIGNRQVATPDDVQSAIAGLQAGDQVQIQYEQGGMLYTTEVTLAARPAGYP